MVHYSAPHGSTLVFVRTQWAHISFLVMTKEILYGRILYHEIGNDDASGLTPVPIEAYVQSSDFDIGDGHNFGFIWRILPDVNFNGSSVNQPVVTMELSLV